MFKRKLPEGHPDLRKRRQEFHIVREATPGKFGFGYWTGGEFDLRYLFYFRRMNKGFSIGKLYFWTNVSNKPEKIDRGLYEFTRQYGMSTYAWVNSKGVAFPLEDGVRVAEFYDAWQRGVVYRMGRIELWQNSIGFEPHHQILEHPEDSYKVGGVRGRND